MKRLWVFFAAALCIPAMAKPPRIDVEKGEDYEVTYRSTSDGSTRVEVVAPTGMPLEVFDGKKRIVAEDIPASFVARANATYRFVIRAPNGSVWEKSLKARAGTSATLAVEGGGRLPRPDRTLPEPSTEPPSN